MSNTDNRNPVPDVPDDVDVRHPSPAPPSDTGDEPRIQKLDAIASGCAAGDFPISELLEKLRAAGATLAEAENYSQQVSDILAKLPEPPENDDDVNQRNPVGDNSNDDDAWNKLQAKIVSAPLGLRQSSTQFVADNYTIPPSVLQAAPHLQLLNPSSLDKHLSETWKLRAAYSSEKTLKALLNHLQLHRLSEPIAPSIWKDVIEDNFVNFDKFHATIQIDYDARDDFKDFLGDYVVVKKDHLTARLPVTTEAEWLRVFSAWESAVCVLFPHRQTELSNYKLHVLSLFHSTPSQPSIAINFDIHMRSRYARSPFRLDDRSQQHESIVAQVLRASQETSTGKRAATSDLHGDTKRFAEPCQNWNLGFCSDPCPNSRKHGFCSECGEQHRAIDSDRDCHSELVSKRRKRYSEPNNSTA